MNMRILLGLVCVVMLAGCSGAGSQPSKEQIESAIKQQLKAGLDVQDIRFKVFPDQSGASGRIDVAGTLVTTEDRVQAEASQADRLRRMVMSAGANQNQVSRYMVNAGLAHVPGGLRTIVVYYEHRVSTGTPIEFTSELRYAETVDGYNINGKVVYDICCDTISDIKKLQGLHLVYDTPEMQEYYEKLLALHKRETETLPQLVEQFFGRLAAGGQVFDGQTVLANIEPFNLKSRSWSVEIRTGPDRRIYSAYFTRIPVTLNVITDFSLAGCCSISETKGKSPALNIELMINYQNPQPNTACLALGAQAGGRYAGPICWDGNLWKWDGREHGGMIEGLTLNQLSVVPISSLLDVGQNSMDTRSKLTESNANAVSNKAVTTNSNVTDPGMIAKTTYRLRVIKSAIDMYKLDNFTCPKTLESLVVKPVPAPANWKVGGYIQKVSSESWSSVSKDAWGNPYVYLDLTKNPGCEVFSLGPDGVESNDDVRIQSNKLM